MPFSNPHVQIKFAFATKPFKLAIISKHLRFFYEKKKYCTSTSKMTDVPKKKNSQEIDLKTHENQKKGGIRGEGLLQRGKRASSLWSQINYRIEVIS